MRPKRLPETTTPRPSLMQHLKDIAAQALAVLMGAAAPAGGKAAVKAMGRVKARSIATGHRSKYTPGGTQRNCGHRGISPKSLRKPLDATTIWDHMVLHKVP